MRKIKLTGIFLGLLFIVALIQLDEAAAAPRSITKCQTIKQSGSYMLVDNLTADGDCLVVSADFVTIDLAGFAITGKGTGEGIKGDGTFRRVITIKNGAINNFADGIAFLDGIQILVERMTVVGNSGYGVTLGGTAIVKDSIISENEVDGINVGSRSVITGNTCSENKGSGIVVGNGSTVVGNTAGVNGNNGLVVLTGSTVANNTTQVNSNFGIYVDCPSNVFGNTATFNGTNLFLSGGSCNSVNNVAP